MELSVQRRTGSPNRSRNRLPTGIGSESSIPLSVKLSPALVERDQPLKLKLKLGLGLGGKSVRTKLPESLKPTTALLPHQATLSSLCVLPASREMKSAASNGLLAFFESRAPCKTSPFRPKVRNARPPREFAFTRSPPKLSLALLAESTSV